MSPLAEALTAVWRGVSCSSSPPEQIEAARTVGADIVELHTWPLLPPEGDERAIEFATAGTGGRARRRTGLESTQCTASTISPPRT